LLERLLVCFCVLFSLPLNGQTDNHAQQAQALRTATVTIRNVVFENAGVLSAQEQHELAKRIRQDGIEFREDRSPEEVSSVTDVAEERVRAACQDEGYFKVRVRAAVEPVAESALNRQFDIVIQVLDSGQRYRLREIHFINATAFSEAELLELIPVRPGEIFSRAKVAKGLEALGQHYEAAGYINFTSIPNTEFDETNVSVRLNIDVDEGKLFRWGDLHITGLSVEKTRELTDGWQHLRGTPYSPKALRDFCARFFRPVPPDTDPAKYTKRKIDEKMGTVDISIAFVSPWWISD
jgi:outer membrane protein assembly factor BamA